MAGADGLPLRKRDRLKRMAAVPYAVRTSDLPKRALSAVVMLAAAGGALWAGGLVLRGFIALVGLVGIAEAVRLIMRATANPAYRIAAIIVAILYIGLAAILLVQMPRAYLVVVLLAVVATDTGAYFSGRAIGGPRIAPRISPSKTWAGLLGGMLAAACWVAAAVAFISSAASALAPGSAGVDMRAVLAGGAAGAGFAIVAQAGDFLESWLKRKAGVKDSSRLIPGHGGVLDRIDGLAPVALVAGTLIWSMRL